MESGVVRVAYKVLVDRREGLRGGDLKERLNIFQMNRKFTYGVVHLVTVSSNSCLHL